jgi:protein-S-isoprenylcysteine O-methyltransferase Ste14
MRVLAFVYGVVCYAIFFAVFLYAMGFIGNFAVPKSIDGEVTVPFNQALIINALLLSVFAISHSVMARPGFKKVWTKIVPTVIERSTYVLVSSLAMILMFWQWQPMGGEMIWSVTGQVGRTALLGLYAFGWVLVLVATFLINHFDLFGLRQVWLYLRGKEYTPLRFGTPGPYKLVRHPLYVGWITVFWATPEMSIAHLVFAIATTAYIVVAIQFEERDLVTYLGEDYVNYRRSVPMLIPGMIRKGAGK